MPGFASDFQRVLSRRNASSAPAAEKRAYTSSLTEPQDWLLQIFGTQAKSGAVVNENTALTVSSYAACVNILAQSIASFPITVKQRTPAGDEDVPDHPLNFIVGREPNSSQTSFRFRSFLQTCLGLGGNSYARIIRNQYFEPIELRPIAPVKIQPRLMTGSLSVVYRLAGEDLNQHEILHLRGVSTDGFMGISPIRALRETIGLSLAAQEFTSRTFNNGNRKPGVLVGNAAMTVEKAKEFLYEWQKNYSGATNAGKTPFIFGGVEWKESGFSNQDAELLLTRQFEVQEIARYFRIPMFLLNANEKSTSWGSGIEQMSRGFVDYTLKPWFKNWEEELSLALFSTEEKKQGYFFKFDVSDLLRGSLAEQSAFFSNLWQAGLVRRNEARRGLGFMDLPDHQGDIFSAAPNSGAAGKPPLVAANDNSKQ